MGLSCVFQYRNKKGGFVADYSMRYIFHLLHSVVFIFCKLELGCENILNQRLELVCHDDPHYVLVLDKFKVD